MTTAARVKEADEASVAFQIALAQIGAKTIEDALVLWQDVPAGQQAATASSWLRQAVRLVLFRRQRSKALGLAYYRLARALRTGTTVANPYKPEPTYVSLSTLRREFTALAGPETSETPAQAPAVEQPTETPSEPVAPQVDAIEPEAEPEVAVPDDEDDDLILVEEIAGLEEELARIDRAAEQEAAQALAELGPKNLVNKIKDINTQDTAEVVDAARAKAHKEAGNRQAASASRQVMNGARSTVYATGQKDQKVIGYVRLSRTGTPCGWCAMLLSRGFTPKSGLYRAERGAVTTSERRGKNAADETDMYHDNCKCYAEPVYSSADLDSSDLYALNRKYAVLWPQVTRGLGGKAALAAWRNFIRRQQAAEAQAAKATQPTAQEA